MNEPDEVHEHEKRTTRDNINATAGVREEAPPSKFAKRLPLQSWVEDTRPGDRTLGRGALSEILSDCSSANIVGGVR